MMRLVLVLVAGGCLQPSSGDDDDGGTWGDGGGAGGASGGGSGGGAGGGGGSACGAWAGIDQAGASWTWGFEPDYVAENGIDGEWTTTATGQTTHEGRTVWETETQGSYTADYYDDYTWHSVSWSVCDADGVWTSGYAGDYAFTAYGTDYSGWYEVVCDEMFLSVPASLAPGDAWTSTGACAQTDSAGTVYEYAVDTRYEVTDSGTVTVPAGSFDALEIRSTAEGTYPFWMAEGVGTVLTEGFARLESYSP